MLSFQKKNPIRNVARLRRILGVFAKHGFQNLVERVKLGKYIFQSTQIKDVEKLSTPRRLRMAFEQLGPTFIKLGQILATRPDLIPKEFIQEFKKLHDQVQVSDFRYVEPVLKRHFDSPIEDIFSEFKKEPIGAASIAQVYRAQLKTGENVVVKVQRPGIQSTIEEDLSLLYFLARLLEKSLKEARQWNLVAVVNEFAKTLKLETDFIVEANNIRKFSENFQHELNIKIPKVFFPLCGKTVLVMEELKGYPLSHSKALQQENVEALSVLRAGIQCYFKMVFEDGFFHGDLHAGNLFVLPNNQIGLVDFGVVGRLSAKSQRSVANMLIALASENYERVAYEYVELSPYSEKLDIDLLSREIRDILSPYYGLTLKDVNIGKLLLETVSVASRHQLVLPVDLIIFFKSIVTIEGMGRSLAEDFDFLQFSIEFAHQIVKAKVSPSRMREQTLELTRDYQSLFSLLPRQVKQLMRKFNSPSFHLSIKVPEIIQLKSEIKKSAQTIQNGMVVASLIIAGSLMLDTKSNIQFYGLPLFSLIGFSLAGLLWFSGLFR